MRGSPVLANSVEAGSSGGAIGPAASATQGQMPEDVVALALSRREPAPVHADHLELRRARILQGHVAHRGPCAVGQPRERGLEIGESVHFLAIEGADERAVRNAGAAEHVAGIRDVYALDGQVVVPRLLVGQRVHDGLAELDVFIRRDGGQRLHCQMHGASVSSPRWTSTLTSLPT